MSTVPALATVKPKSSKYPRDGAPVLKSPLPSRAMAEPKMGPKPESKVTEKHGERDSAKDGHEVEAKAKLQREAGKESAVQAAPKKSSDNWSDYVAGLTGTEENQPSKTVSVMVLHQSRGGGSHLSGV